MKINHKKLEALVLRREGKSYNQIIQNLGVTKGALSYWFRDVDWSKDIRLQLTEKAQKVSRKRIVRLNDLRKAKWLRVYEKARDEAVEEFIQLKESPLFFSGIMLYWGEGDKVFKNGHVRLSNTDPELLFVFVRFLLEICNIPLNKVRGNILLYPDLVPEVCLKFWSKNTCIPRENFCKPTVIQGRHKTKRLEYGVCIAYVNSKYLKAKLLKWIELCSKKFKEAGLV